MEQKPLQGKKALITGSTSGIGLGIAKTLAAAGAQIGLHGLADETQIRQAVDTVEAVGASEVRVFDADLRDITQIETMMADINTWGGIDILVNNAGMQHTTSLADATSDIWNAVLAVNLSAAFHTMRLAMPQMAQKGYGRVINVASVHGLVASKNKAPYVTSKFGLVGLSKVAALEYANAGSRESGGITVNTICPGWTETALIEPQIQAAADQHGGDRTAGIAELLSEKQPSMRTTMPEEIGSLALWLCLPIAHNVTGTSLPIDGGWTAQ